MQELQTQIKSASQDVVMLQTLKSMKRVLRRCPSTICVVLTTQELWLTQRVLASFRLGHTTAENVIDVKGRVACEISTCDELLGTELMFGGVFNELTPEQTVALASCLVFEEKVTLLFTCYPQVQC